MLTGQFCAFHSPSPLRAGRVTSVHDFGRSSCATVRRLYSTSGSKRPRLSPIGCAAANSGTRDNEEPSESNETASGDDIEVTPSPTAPGSGPTVLRDGLLKTLSSLINDESQRGTVEQFILQLEGLNATPITDVFTELGLAGEWKLLFSSTRTRAEGNIRIRKIGQVFDTENKMLTNKTLWSFASKDGKGQVFAILFVYCSYEFVGPGRLNVTLKEHKIKVLQGDDGEQLDLPENLQTLIGELQRVLPVEFFDPSGLMDVSYMEPNFRLARFLGKRVAGVRNVFIRVDSDQDTQEPP